MGAIISTPKWNESDGESPDRVIDLGHFAPTPSLLSSAPSPEAGDGRINSFKCDYPKSPDYCSGTAETCKNQNNDLPTGSRHNIQDVVEASDVTAKKGYNSIRWFE